MEYNAIMNTKITINLSTPLVITESITKTVNTINLTKINYNVNENIMIINYDLVLSTGVIDSDVLQLTKDQTTEILAISEPSGSLFTILQSAATQAVTNYLSPPTTGG